VLVAHAPDEEELAQRLVEPLRQAGYEVAYRGTVLVGESFEEDASKVLQLGGPLVLCGTINAIGTGWAHRLVHAARSGQQQTRIFAVQMQKGLERITEDRVAAAADRAGLTRQEVTQRYERLADEYGLRLAWRDHALHPDD
jgi:hypothetical protein